MEIDKMQKFFIDNEYYVKVQQHPTEPNVCVAKYPANKLVSPPYEEATYQYYFDTKDNELIVTHVETKSTTKTKITQLNKRTILLVDIVSRALKRQMHLNLVYSYDRDNNSCKIINLLPQEERLLTREKELLQIFTDICTNPDINEPSKSGTLETFRIFKTIYENGGLIP